MPSNIQPPRPIACSTSVPANALVASSAVASVSEYCSRNVSGSGSSTSTIERNRSIPGMRAPLTSSYIE